MKALIISDDENLVKSTSSFLENKDYDIIVYKWLLKALDNIEEIRPNLIVVSSSEYPRHWKTLVQFVKSGIGGEDVQIYLYEPTPLSKDDEDKAKVLGINGYFTSVDELENMFNPVDDEVPSVDSIMSEAPVEETPIEEPVESVEKTPVVEVEEIIESVEEPAVEEDDDYLTPPELPDEEPPAFGHIMITHPVDKHFMTGKVTDATESTLTCTLDFETDLSNDTAITKCSYIWNDEIKNVTGTIATIAADKKQITIQVKEYEKI